MQVFHDKDNKRYCLNALSWPQNVLTPLDESIIHLVYSKCDPFIMDRGIVCNMAQYEPKIRGLN